MLIVIVFVACVCFAIYPEKEKHEKFLLKNCGLVEGEENLLKLPFSLFLSRLPLSLHIVMGKGGEVKCFCMQIEMPQQEKEFERDAIKIIFLVREDFCMLKSRVNQKNIFKSDFVLKESNPIIKILKKFKL